MVEVGGDAGAALAGIDGDAEEFGAVREVRGCGVTSPTRLTPDLERFAPGGGLGERWYQDGEEAVGLTLQALVHPRDIKGAGDKARSLSIDLPHQQHAARILVDCFIEQRKET